jgi:DNA-binding SARP family transcriptional activator
MNLLHISLFGHIRVVHRGHLSPIKVTRTCQNLLAYLLLQRDRTHPREVLAGLFWANHSQDHARRNLNSALWRLRQILEPAGVSRGTYLQSTDVSEVGFNSASDYWLDIAAFESQVAHALTTPIQHMHASDAQMLENALQLYTADLLEGFYDDWALRERERLRRMYLNSLAHLMTYYRLHQAFAQSLACGQKILDHDPLREEIHREMMRLYLANGQRTLAARQYEQCRTILADELRIAPMEETQILYAQIAHTTHQPQHSGYRAYALDNQQHALQQLELAVQRFDAARTHLEEAIHLVRQSAAASPQRESSAE